MADKTDTTKHPLEKLRGAFREAYEKEGIPRPFDEQMGLAKPQTTRDKAAVLFDIASACIEKKGLSFERDFLPTFERMFNDAHAEGYSSGVAHEMKQ